MSQDDTTVTIEQAEAPQEETVTVSDEEARWRHRRKILRGKITRTINRLNEFMTGGETSERRLNKLLLEIKSDYSQANDIHGELYNYAGGDQISRLNKWESDLSDDVYSIEEKLEDYLLSLVKQPPIQGVATRASTADRRQPVQSQVNVNAEIHSPSVDSHDTEPTQQFHTDVNSVSETVYDVHVGVRPTHGSVSVAQMGTGAVPPDMQPFDAWIDNLIEYQETVLPQILSNMSISEALFKLEASKNIPNIVLDKFNGDPMQYVDFIERFRIHIHNQSHLSDDVRMIQLRMHLNGDADRALSGLGSSGIMYATALKCLKDQFGQRSIIARACIKKLTEGQKIASKDREGLRSFSVDIINCISIFHRISFYSDVNTSETLRQIVRRFPDPMIISWKNVVTDIREKGQIPTITQVSDFVRKRVKAEFDPDFGDIDLVSKPGNKGKSDRLKGVHSNTQMRTKVLKCYICDDSHRVSDCPTFIDSSISDRYQYAKDKRLCFLCLTKGHTTVECRSKNKCKKNGCSRSHHVLLHSDLPTASLVSSVLDHNGIMPVVRVLFRSPNGKIKEGNVLIDSGAGTTIMRREFAKSLGLQGKVERFDISVVGGNVVEQHRSRRLKFWIMPLNGGEEFLIEAHDMDKTILSVPPLDRVWLKGHPHLADVEFSHKAGPIDLILGVQYSHLHVDEEVRQGVPFEPVARKTPLGWCVIGSDSKERASSVCSIGHVQRIDVDKFYSFETLGIRVPECTCSAKGISVDDRKALEMLKESCEKQGDRYMIGLPWKGDPSMLPNNYQVAEKRLISLEKSLSKDCQKARMYCEAMGEYISNGWAQPVTQEELNTDIKPVYYLPHHGVYRPDKQSTPLRVVFDPACVYNGVSLNSMLHKGPCLIGNLLGVLLRFREQEIAFIGDISKMYLQICLPQADTHVHRFLWRELDRTIDPTVYRLMRVTFGDKPSPDMASFVILRIAEEFKASCPEAALVLERDRYVDDLIHSCQTKEEALQKMNDLDRMLASGSFKIKKWFCSSCIDNSQEGHGDEKDELRFGDDGNDIQLDGEDTIKALGVVWDPTRDVIKYMVKDVPDRRLTKRIVLSRISGIFDPLGLASVVTIRARIALQDIWRCEELDWDDPLPENVCKVWVDLFQDMKCFSTIEFPRSLKPAGVNGSCELHVFADASALAYGAVAYLLWPTVGGPVIQLVSAKARVAPLRQTTIPRLELMAALIAGRLAKTIVTEFKEKPERVYLWTDSQIVLHWLHSDSLDFKAFVGVRVSEIQSTWESDKWKYVPSQLNPADDLSRGLEVKDIQRRWMHGPEFLKFPKEDWPVLVGKTTGDNSEIKTRKPVLALSCVKPLIDPCSYSCWKKLIRVTAYCLRFINNIRGRNSVQNGKLNGALHPNEVGKATNYWFRVAQRDLGDWKSRCADLSPFLKDDIVRVGGRLRRSTLSYEQVHPVLLPSSHPISALYIKDVHSRMGHVGPERTLGESRRSVWIIRGRSLVRSIVKECVTCRKLRQPPHSTLMADLPPDRLKVLEPPFSVTGVDLFGPFLLRYGRNKSSKAWGAIFTCATTRAVHLEIVDGQSTQSFLHALRRFASNHGWPKTIISDNGSSFTEAEKELRKMFELAKKQIEDFASGQNVVWKFNTPLSPHQGGMFESLIKQVKRGIKVAVGNQILSWNEMSTIFSEVKCLVNSRPIGYMPDSPDDSPPLTPNHFMIGRATALVPQGPFEETKDLHKRFLFVQKLVRCFWQRFIREYVPTLIRRSKWQTKGRQVCVGDIVLMFDPDIARGKWDLARVMEVYPGVDGIVRNVKVKTKNGEYQRSVQRCCPILETSA